ncbi:ABC-F type ribosomal protection protein [Clostridioides mangenotii]|uniref:ABC-F type ribosomal protection protein CplR n=1 Tax=Metaclostridioides mangenotii TaxID=1540 RepID=UPI001C113115|nr:ABC-F type ribosomal protection protein CplR [Clostridioides mangenotii]MBU5306691.1 ABC-F type ribosomal protection protein [Clostridioides mangenotii]
MLLSINNLKKSYGDRIILDIDTFKVFEGDRIGLVGANGEGKSTLLKSVIGEIEIDEGRIYLDNSYSYISQLDNDFDICEDSKVKSLLNAPNNFRETLSGGEKTKLKIAQALKVDCKLIIADEPTANIDTKSVTVLEDMLKNFKGAMILVSHDRGFLNKLCNKIAELKGGKLKIYNGNYSEYLHQKELEKDREQFEYQSYINEKNRLEKAILGKSNMSKKIKKTPKRMGNSEARLHKMGGQQQKKKIDNSLKAIQSRIEHLEVKHKPTEDKEIKIIIKDGMEVIGKNILEVRDLYLDTDGKRLLDQTSFKIKRDSKVALIGENGSGKTTLLKEIVKNNNENLKINPRVVIGFFDQEQKILDEKESILENIKSKSSYDETFIRINLNLFGFSKDDIYKKVEKLSGGEKVKVSLCKIILEDNNFLVLDEPTNYLDIISIEALEKALKSTNKTILIVSHDRDFISHTCDTILEIKNKKIEVHNSSFEVKIKNNEKTKEDFISQDKHSDEILILQNKLSYLISKISIENDEKIKEKLEDEYSDLVKKLNNLKNIN